MKYAISCIMCHNYMKMHIINMKCGISCIMCHKCAHLCIFMLKTVKNTILVVSGPPILDRFTTEMDDFSSQNCRKHCFQCFRTGILRNPHIYADSTHNVSQLTHLCVIVYIMLIMCHELHKYIQLCVFMGNRSHYVNNMS